MRRYWIAVLCVSFGACSFDWDAYEPIAEMPAGGGHGGAAGGAGGSTSTSTTTSTTTGTGGQGGVATTCGDGTLDAGEQCEDGNTADGDGCDQACQVECPGGIVHPTSFHCYVIVETKVSWYGARDACLDLAPGFQLVAFSTEGEFDWFVTRPEVVAALGVKRLWTAGNDISDEGVFINVSGEPWIDDLWGPTQPDNTTGAGGGPPGPGEDCVEIRESPDLNDIGCGAQIHYTCERPPPVP